MHLYAQIETQNSSSTRPQYFKYLAEMLVELPSVVQDFFATDAYPLKGLPDDMAPISRQHYEDAVERCGLHKPVMPSWLSMQELEDLYLRYMVYLRYSLSYSSPEPPSGLTALMLLAYQIAKEKPARVIIWMVF